MVFQTDRCVPMHPHALVMCITEPQSIARARATLNTTHHSLIPQQQCYTPYTPGCTFDADA